MKQPLVSIIIPTFNRVHSIGETLESVVAQSYSHWECLIVDDGSSDSTLELLNSYHKKDKRIKWYQRPNYVIKGASSCRNYGLRRASGELIQFLDSDDLLHQDKLVEQVKLSQNDTTTVFTCRWGGFNKSTDLTSRFKYKYKSYKDFSSGTELLNSFGRYNEFFPLLAYLTPRNLIEKTGFWNESLTNNDDGEYFSRILLNADKVKFVREAECYYRYAGNDKLSELNSFSKLESLINSWLLIEKNFYLKTGKKRNPYVRNAKKKLYKKLRYKHPEIITENISFFKTVIPLYKRLKLSSS